MKAVVYEGPYKVGVQDVEDPKLEKPTDALLKVTSAAICGSDLHMYEGRTIASPGVVFGHEIMGTIEQVGDSVTSIKPGDRVVIPFNIACGFCYNCTRGLTSACLTVNPQAPHGAYGYVGMGPYRGGQADYVLVPYADFNCLKLPGTPGDQWEDDFVLLADIFPTGYYATELAEVKAGDTVAVYGAGPVGLLAAYSALLKGASEVYVVDRVQERLQKAKEIGAIPIDFNKGDPAEQIMEMRRSNMANQGKLRPGEEKMAGVMCGIDAVGYEAINLDDPSDENPTAVIDQLLKVVNVTGHIGIIGVFLPQDPGGVDEPAQSGTYMVSLGQIFEKGISIRCGQTPVKMYNQALRDLIVAGRAKPSFIVSHHLPIFDAPGAYEKFDKRIDGYTKVILRPNGLKAA